MYAFIYYKLKVKSEESNGLSEERRVKNEESNS